MQNNNPLNKVVFIQRVVSFTSKEADSPKDLFQLAYVNNSWNDTIKHYSFHLFEDRVRDNSKDPNALERLCVRVIKRRVIWFIEVLMFSDTVMNRINLPILVRQHAPSLDIATLVLEKIYKAGGKDMLLRQLAATDEIGNNCLMAGCGYFSSLEILKLVFEKIVEVGGLEFLKSQLSAKNKWGQTCLTLNCGESSLQTVNLVIENIIEAGGSELLKTQLVATDDEGWTCLMNCCGNPSFPEVLKLIVVILFYFGLFKEQYAKLAYDQSQQLRHVADIDTSFWAPNAESLAKVKQLLEGAHKSAAAAAGDEEDQTNIKPATI